MALYVERWFLFVNRPQGAQEVYMTRAQRSLYGCLVVCVCLILTSAVIQAQEEEAFIQYRQKVMASNGANMGAIGDILKNKLPYQSHITVHAQEIQRMSTIIPDSFKKDIAAGKTDAKPDWVFRFMISARIHAGFHAACLESYSFSILYTQSWFPS
jgi:hypothetical protein